MEHTKKIPAEAVDLYTRFIHGEISRRDFFSGVERFAVAGLTATAIVDALMPNYALGQQVPKNDERIKASYETVPSPNGNGYVRGYFVRPFSADSRSETPAKLPGSQNVCLGFAQSGEQDDSPVGELELQARRHVHQVGQAQ